MCTNEGELILTAPSLETQMEWMLHRGSCAYVHPKSAPCYRGGTYLNCGKLGTTSVPLGFMAFSIVNHWTRHTDDEMSVLIQGSQCGTKQMAEASPKMQPEHPSKPP
jgi:hypothetical protein